MHAALSLASMSYAPASLASVPTMRTTTPAMSETFQKFVDSPVMDLTLEKPWDSDEISDAAGLEKLALELNPIVGYWDPLGIGGTSKENIAWFRHAEIKHGRVAMAAFVGYMVGASGLHFPWALTTSGVTFADISAAGGPGDQWDALPSAAKAQIFCAIGFLELWGESSVALESAGQKHYVRGGKPGFYPPLKGNMPHPVPLDLWDPFGLGKKASPEKKAQSLLAEINNGRWAMIGIFGLISASKGLFVPGLDSLNIAPYAGEYMAPFVGERSTDAPHAHSSRLLTPSRTACLSSAFSLSSRRTLATTRLTCALVSPLPFAASDSGLPFVQKMLDLRLDQVAREAAFLGVDNAGL